MSKRYYKPQPPSQTFTNGVSTLPTDRPIAVYYRQSTDAQIGNISTSIQTIDMVDYLQERGWSVENIYLIDMDAGVSGTTKIDERPGMSRLFDLITRGEIAAVACQDEDRLFRDVTQIQVNIFIEACKTANVLVLTPSMTYDFANEWTGVFHARQFRFKSEMAADYINTVIRGKLHRAKQRLLMEGRWAGCAVLPGYMVDTRRTLPDGSNNPNWRRYTTFAEYAEVVNEYFRIFLSYAGNVHATIKHIHVHGPYYPNPETYLPPDGFKFITRMKQYGHGYCPARNGLVNLLTNATLLGHWSVNGVIVRWNNHPAIVEEEVFWQAFNYLSPIMLDGQPNSNFRPFSQNARPSLETERPVERPLCAGMIVSEYNDDWKKVGTVWVKKRQHYNYVHAARNPEEEILWRRQADFVDEAIIQLVQQKLRATFAPEVWETTLANTLNERDEDRERMIIQQETLERVMESLIASLETLTNSDMIRSVQDRYENAQVEHKRLSAEIAANPSQSQRIKELEKLRHLCEPSLDTWENLTRDEKRTILYTFINRIEATIVEETGLELRVQWVDGKNDAVIVPKQMKSGWRMWLASETQQLLEMVEQGATQVAIAATFPHRTWRMIYDKIAFHLGYGVVQFSPKPMQEKETYPQFCERMKNETAMYKARNSDRWTQEDEETLRSLHSENAPKLAYLKVFPYRRWFAIVKKLRQMLGEDVTLPVDRKIQFKDTLASYLERTGETGVHTAQASIPSETSLWTATPMPGCWTWSSS